MGNASLGRRWPEKVEAAPLPMGETDEARFLSQVHWVRQYAIKPPTPLTLIALEGLIGATQNPTLKAEIEGQLAAARRALDPFNAP